MPDNGFISIQITINGIDLVKRRLATFGQKISDLSPAWEQVGEDLLEDFAQNYAQEGGFFGGKRSYLGASGGPWAPLAESTILDRIRHGYGGAHPILERTGALRESVTIRGEVNNIFETTPTSLRIGTSDPIAGYHQDGTTKGMPARPIVGISWNRRSGIVRRLDQYVKDQIAASGLNS